MGEKKKRKLPESFLKKLNPTPELAEVIGSGETTRQEALKKLWDYIKSKNLQNKREITLDDKLKALFKGELEKEVKDGKITMFSIAKALKAHLK